MRASRLPKGATSTSSRSTRPRTLSVENVRDVIVSGLAIVPVRDRYKIFIIDEVHQLSGHSFNALLKSIEEPPPHVIFMMATTELEKIPETVLSRSQVYEFRTIGSKAIADQLRRIVDAEGIQVGDESLQLIARDGEGSMRDAQSKLDQVIAFTGKTIGTDDVATVLGLVGRDLVLDTIQAVADEDLPAAFALAGRSVDMGYDLRLVCRELSRVVRDLLVLSVDPTRVQDPEIAGEGERERLTTLAARFSREDLLRAFDLLTRAEADIRGAAQPRYHLEMALLRWMHLRKLVSIEDLIAGTPVAGKPSVGPSPSRIPQQPAGTFPAAGSTSVPDCAGGSTDAVAAGGSVDTGRVWCCWIQGRAARRDPEIQRSLLQYGGRAGAEGRGRGHPRDVHLLCHAADAPRCLRAEPTVARIARAAGGRPTDRCHECSER